MSKKTKKKRNLQHKNAAQKGTIRSELTQQPGCFLDTVCSLGPLFLLGVSPFIFFTIPGEFDNYPKMLFLQSGIVFLALLHVFRHCKNGSFTWKRTPLDVPVLLFYVFCLLSLFQAANPYQAVFYLLNWGAGIIFYFLLVNTLRGEKTVDRFFYIAAGTLFLVSLIGILQHLFHIDWIPQVKPPASTFSNRNMASHFVALTFPLTMGCVVIAKRIRITCLGLASLLTAVVFLAYTQTRSAWLALIAVLAALCVVPILPPFSSSLRKGLTKRRLVYALAALVLFSAGIGGLAYTGVLPVEKMTGRFATLTNLKSRTVSLRLIWWKNAAVMVKDNLLWGVGLGNFKIEYPLYHRAAELDWTFSDESQLTRVHNDHLQLLAEIGVLGFCVYAGVFFTFFYIFWKVCSDADGPGRLRALFIALGVMSYLVFAAFSFPMERALPPIYLFTFFGLMGFLYANRVKKEVRVTAGGLQVCMRAGTAAVLVLFLAMSVLFLRKVILSDKYFVHATNLMGRGNIQTVNHLLEKSKIFYEWNLYISTFLARNYTAQGKYREALKEYRQSLSVHPNNINTMLNMGHCYLNLKDYDRAEECFNRFKEITPGSPKVHNNLGVVYFMKKDYVRAEEHYKKAIELARSLRTYLPSMEDYAEPYMNIANVYMKQNRVQDAVKAYETALQRNPGMDGVRKALSSLYVKTGELDKARNVIIPLTQKQKTAADGYVLAGNIYLKQKQYEQALAEYEKARKRTPKKGTVYHYIGIAQLGLNNYQKAEEAFKKAIECNPRLFESYTRLSRLYLGTNRDQDALNVIRKSLAVDPNQAGVRFDLANVYLRSGDDDRAVEQYKKTIQLNPSHLLAHFNLASIFRHQGKKEKAVYHYEKALQTPVPYIDAKKTRKIIEELKREIGKAGTPAR